MKTQQTTITIRLTKEEKRKLLAYCAQTDRTITDVLRDFIRRIRIKGDSTPSV